MESVGMWQQVGFLAEIFELFRRHGLSVDLIGSSETNVTVSLDPSENLVSTDVLAELSADLAKVCRVKEIAPCAAITLVRSEEHTSELQSLMRISYAVFCLKHKNIKHNTA